MLKCNAPGCTSNETTQINGKTLTLFSFPTYDDSLFKQWEENSKVIHSPDKNPSESKLCELHFESKNFASKEKNALAPGAVPTIFESNNKRRIQDDEEQKAEAQGPPLKQRKSREDEKPAKASTPRQNPVIESKQEASIDKSEKSVDNIPPNIMEQVQKSLNKKGFGSSVFTKQIDMGKKVYRLIIRIDKLTDNRNTLKDGEKLLAKEEKEEEEEEEGEGEEEEEEADEIRVSKSVNPVLKNGGVVKPCSKTGCKLIKTTLNSKPVFQCERCSKYYIVKESKSDVSNWTCYICSEVLPSPDSLSFHIRKHFTCDMCQAQCSTQISYDKHIRLHVSTDPLLPYKCHKCSNTFEVKADVRQHYAEKHAKNLKQDRGVNNNKQSSSHVLFRCQYCYAVFKKEEAYKSHVDLHMGDGEFDCALCSKRFKTAKHLATHQARHLGTVKYTCRVCSDEFTGLEAVEDHMKTHMVVSRDEHKCNICKKIFKNESILNSHMRGHLSRAHRCPSCHKAFINKTTLGIHFKTHSKAASNPNNRDLPVKKKHTCTLCPSAFESRSQLYNHIMTHLEQMHGGEGGDVVLDGLGELLESEEDIHS